MIKRFADYIVAKVNQKAALRDESNKLIMGQILVDRAKSAASIRESEFKIFSQWGDDGIIQYLIHNAELTSESFVEFGVENYKESNTRFLLINNNWRGLIMDSNEKYMEQVRNESIYWQHELTALSVFITKDNINDLLKNSGFDGELGILSIDIDGNDYWVWEAMDNVDPAIVIVEYNSVFGSEHAITIPYQEDFNRTEAHYSNLFWGASLGALYELGQKKGYHFVGCNQAGNNAFFVKKEKIGKLKPMTLNEGFVASKFRDSRDKEYNLDYKTGKERIKAIEDCEVFDITSEKIVKIKDL